VFYSHDRQTATQPIYVNFTQNAPEIGFGTDLSTYAFAGGPPYGPGSTALANYLGIDNLPGSLDYYASWQTIDEQLAGFAQADYNLTQQLKLTLGVRFSRNKLSYRANFNGPETNGNAPYGLPCLPNTYCATADDFVTPGQYAVGTGPFTPVFPASNANSTETATTPKVGISYQINDANMVYATAAKGFRPAGASLRVPSVCQSDLVTFGYVDAQGHSTQPVTYGSDSVWSYEVGSKNRLFDGRLVLDGSLYEIRWSHIQTDVFLPDCAYDFVDNLASATSKGFDLAFQAKPFAPLTLSGAIGYNSASFDRNALSPSGVVIYPKGSSIPNSGPPWTASFSGEYDIDLFGSQNWYWRADWTRTSRLRPVGAMLPGTPQYDPLLLPDPAYALVNTRLGVRLAGMDLSLFVNNVFDANPLLNMQHSIVYDPQEFRASALRPRTYGITVTYRH
jgi:outer membrane receptor protein involved in Fe transport